MFIVAPQNDFYYLNRYKFYDKEYVVLQRKERNVGNSIIKGEM